MLSRYVCLKTHVIFLLAIRNLKEELSVLSSRYFIALGISYRYLVLHGFNHYQGFMQRRVRTKTHDIFLLAIRNLKGELSVLSSS